MGLIIIFLQLFWGWQWGVCPVSLDSIKMYSRFCACMSRPPPDAKKLWHLTPYFDCCPWEKQWRSPSSLIFTCYFLIRATVNEQPLALTLCLDKLYCCICQFYTSSLLLYYNCPFVNNNNNSNGWCILKLYIYINIFFSTLSDLSFELNQGLAKCTEL